MIHAIRRTCVGLIAGAACLGTPAVAQTYTWRNAAIGGGGFVTGTVFHPTVPGLVYTRTDVGGIYRLDATTNRWIPLNDAIGGLNNEFQHLGVLTIGLDPNDANRVYIATGQYAGSETWKLPSRIYRSSDRGNTWTYTTPGFKMAGNGEGRGTGERMAVDPLNGANILVGSNDAGIWRSTDHGASWARLSGFPSTLTNLTFLCYAPANHTNPGPNRRVYAGVNTLTGQSFWFSDDNGTTWSEAPNHPGRNAGTEMMPLQASFDAAGVLYSTWGDATGPGNYATDYGVWKLSADATTWTSILPPTGQGFFGGISADPRVAGHVVVTTLLRWWPGDEVYRSTNGGTTWTAALRTATKSLGNSPWATPSPHWITDIDIDPHNSDRAIFNTGFGLFLTDNLAATGTSRQWTFFNDGLEETVPLGLLSPTAGPPLVSVIGDYTGFRHDHLGRSPARGALSPGSGSTSIITGADLAPAKMIRQNSGTTLYSQDAGATWAGFPTTPEPIINGHGRVILSTDGQRLLWCPPNSPAFVSTDNGGSWSPVPSSASLINPSATPTVAVLAGAAGSPGTTNASGGSARFNGPSALALDPAGVRYVADTANHTIRRIQTNGAVNTLAGGAGVAGSADATGTAARFNQPAGIAVAADKTVFVADTANHTIRKIDSGAVVTTIAGAAGLTGFSDATGGSARFNSPTGLALDAAGNLYVCDTGNHSIRRITPAGAVTTIAGNPGLTGTTNANGTSALFNSPRGIAIDAAGNLYVADSGNHAIRRIATNGDVTTFAGQAGTLGSTDGTGGSARFNSPKAITIDASGTLHVADSGNHTIRRITPAGGVSTVAGLAGNPGSTVGNGSAARFSNPSGIAAASNGINLYVSDTGNHTVRRGYHHNTLVPLADKVDGNRFHLWDGTAKRLLTSSDSGASFSVIASNVNAAFAGFHTVPGHTGHIWARADDSGLYRSTNSGASFTKVSAVASAYRMAFGRAKPGNTHPAVFIWGKTGTTTGFFRSDDTGATWTRINDNLHQFGYQNDLAADPRVHGRVYLATSGRGVIVGDIANPAPPASQPSQLIYDDALTAGWTNTNPGDTNLQSAGPVRRGTRAIAVPAGSNKGFSVTCANRSLEGFAALAFWITGGSNPPPPLQIGASRGGIPLEAVPVTVPATTGWQRIVIPLTDLDLSNIPDLSGLRIESRTLHGTAPGAFSIDDIELVGNDEFNGITTATITLGGLEQTYDGSAKPVTFTTNPPGLPVVVTYNGSSTPPVNAGSYAVSAAIDAPAIIGSAGGTLSIARANATILLDNLAPFADGTPKAPAVTTTPSGLPVSLTYNGSSTAPALAGSYAVSATINHTNYQGGASGTLLIRQPALAASGITGWVSNVSGKVTAGSTSSPLLNPNDTTDQFSTNTLHAAFNPITLANAGDKITLSGSFQLTVAGVSGQNNWFRFGLYDNRGQAPAEVTGWLGLTAMGNPNTSLSLYERVSTGLFSTGSGATARIPDALPAPFGVASPAGNPEIAFEVTATRTAGGVVFTHKLTRIDTSAVLLSYTFTDPTPNNNGSISGAQNTASDYPPTFNTAGFAFARAYISNTGAQAQFSNVTIAFQPGVTAQPQTIDFPPIADRTLLDPAFALNATAGSGLPVSYQLIGGPATLSGGTITPTGTGTITVRASQQGNLSYLPAPEVDRAFNVTKAPATVTLNGLNQTYTGSPKPVTATSSEGSPVIAITYNGSPTAPTDSGSYTVVATIDDPIYQGSSSGTLVIGKAAQTITFNTPPDRTFGDAPFDLAATASSGLPVSFTLVSGQATLGGSTLTLTGAGTVTVLASQTGGANHLAAPPVERSFLVSKAAANVFLGNLEVPYDGLPKPVTVTTVPAGLPVNVTYNGSPNAPLSPGSYAVSAVVDAADHAGSANGTLVIGNRGFTQDLTGWIATSSTMADAGTSSPLWNPDRASAGISGSAHAFFAPIQLAHVGDSIQLTGTVAIDVLATSRTAQNRGLWFRFGLFRNPSPVTGPASPVNNWLGYCGMANSTPALYERTGTGDYGSSIYGATARTPQVSANGTNSTQNSITLGFTQTVTRTATGADVSFDATNTANGAKVISFTFSDTTPNNNGVLSGAQSTPSDPPYAPAFSAAGFAFSGEYIGTSTANARFTNVRVSYSSPAPGSSQTIDFPPISNQSFGGPPVQLNATATSGLPVTYQIVGGQAGLSGNILTPAGVGEITVRAIQNGNIDFLPAAPVEQTFTVAKAPALVSLSNLAHTYDGETKSALVATDPTGLVVDLRYDGGQAAPVGTGTYEVTAVVVSDHYQGSASGTLVISPELTALQAWRKEYFGTPDGLGQGADAADPDHDGLMNLMEFATGTDPTTPSITPVSLDFADDGRLEFTYHRLRAAIPEVVFLVEWSDSPGDEGWTSDQVIPSAPVPSTDGRRETVRALLPEGNGRRFVRLRVTSSSAP